MPATFTARAIGYKHADSNGRQWLLTSLKDPVDYPADERIALYHERWEIDLGYDSRPRRPVILSSSRLFRSRERFSELRPDGVLVTAA